MIKKFGEREKCQVPFREMHNHVQRKYLSHEHLSKLIFPFGFKILRNYFRITCVIRLLNNNHFVSTVFNSIDFSENILGSYIIRVTIIMSYTYIIHVYITIKILQILLLNPEDPRELLPDCPSDVIFRGILHFC